MSNKNTRENISVAGGWLGEYRYGGSQSHRSQVRFEASISTSSLDGSNLFGEIIDDCALGIASLSGSQEGAIVRFDKHYKIIKPGSTGRVEYSGLVSDDGKVMRGTWRISVNVFGRRIGPWTGAWEARRMWSEEEEEQTVEEGEPIRAVSREELSVSCVR